MRIGFKAKRIIKAVALALAGVAAITAIAFGVKAIVDWSKNDLKEINPSFEVGSLGSDGKYVADEGALYTKEAFACYGLQVKPEFDSTVDYQIYYYDWVDNYIGSTDVLSAGFSADAPTNGAYARMVITPRNDEDDKIGLFEKVGYAKQLSIKVKKDQEFNKRFQTLRGRTMQIVYDTRDLVFSNKITFSEITLSWNENQHYCATSTCILKVDGGSKVVYDFSSLDEKYDGAYCRIFQFTSLPLDENLLSGVNASTSGEPFVLDKATQYIIICVDSNSATSWTDNELVKFPKLINITK